MTVLSSCIEISKGRLRPPGESGDVCVRLCKLTSSTKISPTKVNDVCDALRAALEKRDMLKYTETILTTHVCKQPADYESGLRVLLRLQSGLFATFLKVG